jgi:hypothetical protein
MPPWRIDIDRISVIKPHILQSQQSSYVMLYVQATRETPAGSSGWMISRRKGCRHSLVSIKTYSKSSAWRDGSKPNIPAQANKKSPRPCDSGEFTARDKKLLALYQCAPFMNSLVMNYRSYITIYIDTNRRNTAESK